jgi:hypothetical protein
LADQRRPRFLTDVWIGHPPEAVTAHQRSLTGLCLSEFKLARTDDEVRREMA